MLGNAQVEHVRVPVTGARKRSGAARPPTTPRAGVNGAVVPSCHVEGVGPAALLHKAMTKIADRKTSRKIEFGPQAWPVRTGQSCPSLERNPPIDRRLVSRLSLLGAAETY